MSNAFKKLLEKNYGDEVYFGTQKLDRWGTGIYAYNKALGGGFVAGRMHLLVGKESVGKSTIASKVAGIVNSTCQETGKIIDPTTGNGCKVLYVDAEGTLDIAWCKYHNYYPDEFGNLVVSTNTGNQAIDIVNAAIQSGEFSFIILDSIEALIPFKDLEKSSEDFVMGTKAKMNNDGYRRWQVSINEAARKQENWWLKPTFLAINQLRDSIGSVPMPPTIPGGIGQKQFSTTITQMNSPKYSDDGKLSSKGIFKGVVKKNKAATPRAGFEFEMALKDLEDLKMGEVNNNLSIIQDVRKYKIWEKKDDLWHLFQYTANKQDEFLTMMLNDPDIAQDIMIQTIQYLAS